MTSRNAFRDGERLKETLQDLKTRDLMDGNFTTEEFLGLIPEGETPAGAAYKFAAANEVVSTIMVTSSNIEHLRENVSIFETVPLPEALISTFRELFNHIDIPVGT